MYVKNHMLPKDKLTTLELGESIGSALEKINQGDFLSLPVLDGNQFKGYLMKEVIFRNYFETNGSDRDEYLKNTKVEDLYSTNYKSINENEYVENASYLLKEWRTPFLPVFDIRNNFVGILTHNSIFNAFSEIFGLEKGTRLVVDMLDIPGQLAKLAEVIRKENVNIINFAAVDAKILDVYRVIIRVNTKDVTKLVEKIKKAGFKVG
ncbi:CBS domain-containing protein [Clostridium sp. Cult2]|uniref:CBS domain-containing protein n=1 Tax=Clostridium sp. Cult2 TaxID=2079003 RepID=UPI001F1B043E|nr:CBS domain-containing protein [Clostridium sp. Cult2]MCF6465905.1 CBS domain-containing protein [Clostridium sp. Cult2]